MFMLAWLRFLVAFTVLSNGCLRRLAVRQKLDDARYRRPWRRSHAHCRWHRGHTPACKPNPNLKQRPPRALLDNSCCYAHYSCGNNCNAVIKLMQECTFLMHFTSVLRKQFAANDTFLREANGYKQVLALRNSWLV